MMVLLAPSVWDLTTGILLTVLTWLISALSLCFYAANKEAPQREASTRDRNTH